MPTPGVLSRLFNQPCSLVTRVPGPPDPYGDPTWVETVTESRCYAEQATASEPGDPNYQAEEWRILLDADVPTDGLDAVVVDGKRFEVIGPPWRAFNPRTKTVWHTELRAKATTP